MTTIDLSPRLAAPGPGARKQDRAFSLPAFLGRLLCWLHAWEHRHHLHALSDHTLKDMGFLRDQIDDVMRGVVRRPD